MKSHVNPRLYRGVAAVFPLIFTLLAMLAVGCKDGPSNPEESTCVRDNAQIDERAACVTDEHCPCGAHCSLGECVADCRSNSDCDGGERCDLFGYCRDENDTTRIPEFAPVEQGTLVLGASRMDIDDPAEPVRVRISAHGRALGPIRALAEANLEVSCDAGTTFAQECRFDSLEVDSSTEVWVQATEPLDDDEIRVVRIFTGTQRDLVSFTSPTNVLAALDRLIPTDAPRAIGGPLEGTYLGRARLVRSSVSDNPSSIGERLSSPEVFEISAEIHADADVGSAIVALQDPAAILAGTEEWIADLDVAADGTGTIDFPTTLLHTGMASFGEPVEILLETPPADVLVDVVGARTVSFTLTTRQVGSLTRGLAVQSAWSITLFRVGDLESATRPTVPADATASVDATRANLDTNLESVIDTELLGLVSSPDHLFGVRNSVWPAFEGAGDNLIACALPSPNQEVIDSAWIAFFADEEIPIGGTSSTFEFSAQRLWIETDLEMYLMSPDTSPLLELVAADHLEENPITGFGTEHFFAFSAPSFDGALPCEFDSSADIIQSSNGACGGDPRINAIYPLNNSTPVDVCAEMAARYDCEIVDSAPGDVATMHAEMRTQGIEFGCGNQYDQDIELQVQRRCVFPDPPEPHLVPRRCGELASCFDPSSVAPEPDGGIGGSARFGSTVETISGDLQCDVGSGVRGAMLAVDLNEADLKAPAMLRACIAELEALNDDPSAATGLGELFAPAECVNATRLFYAASQALESTRVRTANPRISIRADEEALAIRLLQRWVQLHGFIARQSAQAERLAQLIRRLDPSDDALPPPIDEVLASSLQGWNLLLHPRFADAIANLDPATVASPDYRSRTAPAFVDPVLSGREQGDGLAVAILDTLTAQMELVEVRLERAQRTGDLEALDRAFEVLRHVNLMRPLAQHLFNQASSTGIPVWQERYQRAQVQLDGNIASAFVQMQSIREGRNPFGIEEDDLPLYFLADTIGAGGRFTAISDFLLGPNPAAASNFAPFSIRQAAESLDDARDAWTAFRDRETQRMQSAAELDERLEEINLRFGGELTSYCGAPAGLDTVDVLDGWDAAHGEAFNAETCFYNRDEPGCSFDLGTWAQNVTTDDLLFQYCVADELAQRTGELPALEVESTREVLEDFMACASDAVFPVTCGTGSCMECRSGTVIFEPQPAVLNGLVNGAPNGVIDAARASCRTQFPTAIPNLPGLAEINVPALENAACYRGSLGQAALTARAVAQDVEIARSEFAEFQERYDIAMNSCMILQLGNMSLESATATHNATMRRLRNSKLAADAVANSARAVKECAATAGSPGNPYAAGASCAAGAAEGVAESVSDAFQRDMEEAQDNHDALMAMIENDIAEDQCFNDAEMELVGVRTAGLRIQRAASDLQLALFQMSELQILATTAYNDGRGSLEAARDRAVAPMAHDYWLDEKLETYVRRMRNATRIAYLTVRAVEYEFQQSLDARGLVLAAEVPDDLEQALDELWSTAGTRRINGNAPTDLKVVVSLKRNLLQLANNASQPPGYSALTDTDRLRLLLLDPRYEVYEDGEFVGRAIPFNLAPLEELGLGRTAGVSVFARNSCAERLWSVNATIHGDEDRLFIGDDPSFVDIQLLKANTFYSQWCTDGADTDFQEASVRPSRNLFADPSSGSLVGDELGLGNETSLFSRARMQAFFNVDRDEFSEDDFANGDSTELAARGLYGRYAIFLPAGVLSDGGSDGLNLNAIEDILLRLDYVSVAR